MTIVALLQNRYPVLNAASDENLHGLEAQVYHNFFEALEEKHNHIVLTAESLAAYQSQNNPAPDIVICAPLPDEGNVAPGLDALRQIREAFPRTPSSFGAREQRKACARPAWMTWAARPITRGRCWKHQKTCPGSSPALCPETTGRIAR